MNKNFWKGKKVVMTGGTGFVGSYVVKLIEEKEPAELLVFSSKKYDLLNPRACRKVVKDMDIVIHLAAKVGGIGLNRSIPAEMYYDNIMMGTQLMHESYLAGVKKFVALGTICCYPKYTRVPFKEDDLWMGYPEETNAPYGMAKKMLLVQSQAYRQQYKFNSIFLLPVNIYGPGDNFDPDSSHVIPALIKKFHDAKRLHKRKVKVWGTGKATREFLYVEDAAKAIILATERYNKMIPVNIGAGFEVSIKSLAEKIQNIIGFKGEIEWDTTKPDGQPRRMLDTSRAEKEFDFIAETDFDDGLRRTIHWYERKYIKNKLIKESDML